VFNGSTRHEYSFTWLPSTIGSNVQTLVEKISSTFVPRDITVLYRISCLVLNLIGASRPGARTLVFVLKRLTQSACGSVSLVSMPVWTRAGQSTSSAMSTDTNSLSSDMFLRSKGWIPWRFIVGLRLVLLAAQHHSKDPTGKLRHEWEVVGYYLSSSSNVWTWLQGLVCCTYLVSPLLKKDGRIGL